MDGVSFAPHLKVKPILLLHRNKPPGHEDYQFPIGVYWYGDDVEFGENLCKNCKKNQYTTWTLYSNESN